MRGLSTRGQLAAFTALATIAGAVGLPGVTHAREADSVASQTSQAPDPETAASVENQATEARIGAEPAGAQGGDIVVTARRRDESLQDVPAAVTAVSGEAIDTLAITDLRTLSGRIPNLRVEQGTTSSSASQIFLRGIGIDNTGFNTDPNVGVYIDDIFVGRLIGSMVSAVDLDRIEVLRGPQGTLYGRNSTAGAIKYVTRRPDLDDLSGKFIATFGSYDRRTIRGTVNVPLIPGELAVMFNAQSHQEDGYIKLFDDAGDDTGRRANGRNVFDARASLLWQPNEDFSVYLTGDLTRNRSGLQSLTPTNCVGTQSGILADGTVGQVSVGQFQRCPLFYDDPYASYVGPFPFNDPKFDSKGVSASISYDLGFATLKSITGYRGFEDVFSSVLFGKPPPATQVNLRNALDQDQFQQEFQLTSNSDGWLSYIVGLFYYHEDIRSIYQTQQGTLATIPRINDDHQVADAYAVYGEFYLRPIERFEITLGGRMSFDKKKVTRLLYPSAAATTPTYDYEDKISTNKFTPRIGVSYDTGPVLVYATYSEGYRAPGYANANPANLAAAQFEFPMESETSYEVGVRSQLFDRMLTFNASAFSADYKNLAATLTVAGVTSVVTSDARIRGLEVEANFRPVRGLNIFGNLSLLEDKYTKPPLGQPYARRLKHAPRTSWLLGADYETSIGAVPGTFFIGGDVNYTSSAFRNVANTIDQQSDPYTLVTARAGYRAEDDKWSLTVGGTNLTDKVYYLLGTQNQARSYQPGRRLFATFEVNF